MINIKKLKQKLSYEQEISRLISAQICSLKGAVKHPLRILDVGCGTTSMLAYFNSVEYRKSCYLIGLDVHPSTIEWCRTNGFHDEYLLCDADNYQEIPNVDVIIATDLIEHFEKEAAIKLIATFESKASLGVFLTTPNGYIHNPYSNENLFMQHKCGFSVEDFRKLGYECFGLGGPIWLRGDHALPCKPKILTLPMLMVLSRVMRMFPKYSFHIFAKKIQTHLKSE